MQSWRPRSVSRAVRIAIDQSQCHILSNEPTQNLDQGGEQRFEGRGRGRRPELIDARYHAVELDVVSLNPADLSKHRVFAFRASQRPREQRVAPVVSQ